MIGNINSIETLGLLDGPGIRYVIFMQGCNMRCIFCHNPESWDNSPDQNMSVTSLIEDIMKYQAYFGVDGGVTVSGGEPLLQVDFVKELFKELKKLNINTCLDTSGFGDNYLELLDYTDLVMLSIKGFSADEYVNISGQSINKTLFFIDECNRINKRVRLRYVVMEGINDDLVHINNLVALSKKINNLESIELLPYRSLGKIKYDKLNMPYKLDGLKDTSTKRIEELMEVIHGKKN